MNDSTHRIVYATASGTEHDKLGHPECAARIPAIQEALNAAGLTAFGRPDQVGLPHANCPLMPGWAPSPAT